MLHAVARAADRKTGRSSRIFGRYIWVTKWRAGTCWGNVVDKVWNEKEDILSMEEFAAGKAEVQERTERRERLAFKNKEEGE